MGKEECCSSGGGSKDQLPNQIKYRYVSCDDERTDDQRKRSSFLDQAVAEARKTAPCRAASRATLFAAAAVAPHIRIIQKGREGATGRGCEGSEKEMESFVNVRKPRAREAG